MAQRSAEHDAWATRLAHVVQAAQLADEYGEYRLARQLHSFESRLRDAARHAQAAVAQVPEPHD